MQQTLINQMDELVKNLTLNKHEQVEYRIGSENNTQRLSVVLFGDEFDKISNQLEEFVKQMEICQFPNSSYAICHHPEDPECKLYVYTFQINKSLTEEYYLRFIFLKGIRDSVVDLGDYPVLKQVKF